MDDDQIVLKAIWNNIPERREALEEWVRDELESAAERNGEPYLGTYSLISDVLLLPTLIPQLDSDHCDEELLRHCALALEEMLSVGSSYISDAVAIRVGRKMLSKPARWRKLRPFAGPLLRELMVVEAENNQWRTELPEFQRATE